MPLRPNVGQPSAPGQWSAHKLLRGIKNRAEVPVASSRMKKGEPDAPLIFVIFGAGGVGKGTLVSRLLDLRDGLWLSRSWTTRPRRPSEPQDAYVWVSREQFVDRVASGGFVEWNEFAGNGHLYGTPTMEPPSGSDVVLEIDPQGALQVIKRYPDAVLILVGPLPVRNRPGGCSTGVTTTRTSKSVWPWRRRRKVWGAR